MNRRIALLAITSCLTSTGLTGCAIKSRPSLSFKKAPLAMGASTDVQIPGYELKCIFGKAYSYVIFSDVVDALKFSRQKISGLDRHTGHCERPGLVEAPSWRFEAAGSRFYGRNDDQGRISAQYNEMPAIPAKFIKASFFGLFLGFMLFKATLSAVVRNLREQGFLVLNDHPSLFEIWSLCSGGDIEPRELIYNKNGVSITHSQRDGIRS